MRLRKIIVYDLKDFICRCGSTNFKIMENSLPNSSNSTISKMKCRTCGRVYRIHKKEKRMRINNLPMSFGSRSLHWKDIIVDSQGLSGSVETVYEIEELPAEKEKK
ncbi:MAG: hypothetical protein J7K04_09865 [Spirochaetales bacterium]|nr:hypothetical protein [Spirochaetales bacterium]